MKILFVGVRKYRFIKIFIEIRFFSDEATFNTNGTATSEKVFFENIVTFIFVFRVEANI